MQGTFWNADAFNQLLAWERMRDNWDVASVPSFSAMFKFIRDFDECTFGSSRS